MPKPKSRTNWRRAIAGLVASFAMLGGTAAVAAPADAAPQHRQVQRALVNGI